MRLISWDGRRDVSYENCHLVINPRTFEIEAITGNTNFEPVMGIYSTEAKAIKVMEMLRNAYCGLPIIMKNVDISDEVIELFKDLKKNGIIFQKVEENPSVEYVNNTYFKFPDDSEVEV